jgi:hypothetical protein
MVVFGLFVLLDATQDIVNRLVIFGQDIGPDNFLNRSRWHFVQASVESRDEGRVAIFKRAFHRKVVQKLRVVLL